MNTNAALSIHAHDVMAILAETPLVPDDLFEELRSIGGSDPRFHTCSLQGLSFEEILVFLKERGKIQEIEGLLHFTGNSCGH